jgi:hypothetical protein
MVRMARERGIRLLLLLLAAFGLVSWVGREIDFHHYLEVGNAVLGGRDIYADTPPGVNTWPPFFSFFCALLAVAVKAGPRLAQGTWLLLNYAMLLWVLSLLARVVYGRTFTLGLSDKALTITSPEILVPLVFAGPFVTAVFEYSQVDLLVFTLALSGLSLFASDRPRAGGLALGASIAMKVTPVLFIPYFMYRRKWRAAAWTTGWTALLSLSPILVYGWSRFRHYLSTWASVLQVGWGVGKYNQSVFAMWDRILGHGMLPFTVAGIADLPKSGDPAVRVAWLASIATVTILAVALFRGEAAARWGELCEWSVVFLVAGFFGTVTWKHHLVSLLLPCTVLFAGYRSPVFSVRVRRTLGVVALGAALLGYGTSRDLWGGAIAGRLEMGSIVTYAGFLLVVALFWFRWELGWGNPMNAMAAASSEDPTSVVQR